MEWETIDGLKDYPGMYALLLFSDGSGVKGVARGHYNENPEIEGWFEMDYSDEVLVDSYSHYLPLPKPPVDIT